MKYTIIICDDNPDQANNLISKIKKAAIIESGDLPDTKIELKIDIIAQTASDVVNYVKKNSLEGGIYFLDIELSKNSQKMNGVDLAEQIKKMDKRAQIAFITAYNEYMELTFERRIGAVDYINKNNIDLQTRLNETLRDAVVNLSKENYTKKMTFSYRLGHIIKNINIDDIYYITTTKAPHKLRLIRKDGQADFVGDIKTVDEQNEFLKKISQSYLVNPKNIKQIDLKSRQILFPNNDKVKFSRRFNHIMKNLISQYNLARYKETK